METSKEVMKAKTNTTTREESAIVERVARIVLSVRGSKPDYTRLAAELEQALPFDIFGVVLLRHDREAVRVAVCTRKGEGWQANYHQHPYSGSMLESVVQKPQLQVKEYADGLDGSPAESGDALSGNHQLRTTVIAPLLIEDRVLGTVELGSMVSGTYQDETLQRLIKAVGHVLASAIESAQSSGSAEMQDRQRKALKDVSSAITSEVELSTILNQIVEGIAKALHVASAVFTINWREKQLCLEAQSGLDAQKAEDIFSQFLLLEKQCIIGESLLQQQVRISQDIMHDERYLKSQKIFRELQMFSICSYPLVTGNTVYGALLLCSPEPGGFTPLKVDILSLFASQAMVAIHNCTLLEAAQQRSSFQEAIARLEQVHQRANTGALQWGNVAETTEEDPLHTEYEMVEHIREEAQRVFGVSFSSLLRFISNHLLTQHERDLHAVLHADQEEQELRTGNMAGESLKGETEREDVQAVVMTGPIRKDALAHTVELLSQTAEAALLSTDMLGELSRLLLQLQHTTGNSVKDAWFVVDVQGKCVYMNPIAEALCDVRLENMAMVYETQLLNTASRREGAAKIENIFARLLLRIRNEQEVVLYLQDLGKSTTYRQDLQCVLAAESLHPKYRVSLLSERATGKRESVPTDYHYQLKRYPLYNQQGQFIAHALQVHDITEQVRDEKNRSALLSAVSHDLRTPLTTIKAAVTGLLQEDLLWEEKDRKEILQDIESETDHLTVLVNALVEMSRIEMGALSLDKEWCDLVEVFYGARKKIERTLGPCVIKVVLQEGAQDVLPLVYADHVQLERVFFYLLENSVRYGGEQREIEVRLEAVMAVAEARMVRIAVTDQGRGLTAEEREHVFNSYTTGTYGTNGLGLVICKGIIEAHQGEIVVESTPEGGARYTFTLPAHPSPRLRNEVAEIGEQEWVVHQRESRDGEGQQQAGEKR